MDFFHQDVFSKKKVGNFPFPENPIVEVLATESVDSAFKKLVQHQILSAPCWDEERNEYLGFFDITDALSLIYSVDLLIRAIPDAMLQRTTALRLAAMGCPDGTELKVGSLFEKQANDDRSKQSTAWNPITDDAPMSQVIFLLATSTRRVPVIDVTTRRVKKILSQSLVTQVLHETLKEMELRGDKLPDLFQKTPRASGGFGLRKVFTVDAENNVTSEAFHIIIENGVSAVAVLDDEGKLLSSITTKDIRLFGSTEAAALQRLNAEQTKREPKKDESVDNQQDDDKNPKEHLALMDLSCGDFVSMIELTAVNKGYTRAPAVVVNVDMPIRKIIARMAVTKKHRVFVVDEQRVPIGVISVSDIAKLLVTDPSKKE